MIRGCDLCRDPEPDKIWVGPSDVALCDVCYNEVMQDVLLYGATVRTLPPTHAQPDPPGLAGPRRPV